MFPYFPNWDKIQQRSDCEARYSALVHLLHVWISLNIPYNSRERAALAQYSDTGMVTSRGMVNKSKVFIIHLCWAYLQLAWKNENRDSPESLSLYLGWILNEDLTLGTWFRACQFSDFNLLLMIRWVPVMNETGRVCVCREQSHNVRWQWLPPCHQHPPTTMKGHYRSSSQGHHIN